MAMRTLIFSIAFVVTLIAGEAVACNCPPRTMVEEYRESTAVFLGKIVSVSQKPLKDKQRGATPHFVVEYATMAVLKAWKGTKIGQIVRLRSEIGPGPCGISCRNNPPWLLETRPHSRKTAPAKVSDRWLVYGYNREPYELSLCSRSLPINIRPAQDDMTALDKIVR
jgi:hypothetical protein